MSNGKLVAFVVIPFTVLCAAGLWWSSRPVPPSVVDFPPLPAPAPLPAPPAPVVKRPPPSPPPQPAPPPPAPVATPPRPDKRLTRSMLDLRGPLGSRPLPFRQLQAERLKQQPRLEREGVRAAIDGVKPLVRQCFMDARDRYPPPQKVTLSFTIEGQGLTGYFKDGEVLDSTIQDPWLQSCFLQALTDAKFQPPEGGGSVRVTYPFSFSAADAG